MGRSRKAIRMFHGVFGRKYGLFQASSAGTDTATTMRDWSVVYGVAKLEKAKGPTLRQALEIRARFRPLRNSL